MIELTDYREIHDPYKGSLEWRIDDLCARIGTLGTFDVEETVLGIASILCDFALQHIEDIDRTELALADVFRHRFSGSDRTSEP